jgi:hypothetical protein
MSLNRITVATVLLPGLLALCSPCAAELRLHEFLDEQDPSATLAEERPRDGWDRWSFQFGAAYITGSTIDELLLGQFERPEGPAQGHIYLLSASYTLHTFDWDLFGHQVRPQLQLPGVLGIVDERGRSPFGQYSLGITLRWRDFPWNEYVYTNFETGIGLTYSQYVLAIERQRHPERNREHVEFYWPIELMLAHPRHRQHQLVLFLHHHSGGEIFHRGGANSLGIGYRLVFGER